MYSILSSLFAWISFVLILLLIVLFPLSRMNGKQAWKQKLLIWHKPLGILVLFTMLTHGILSMKRPMIDALALLVITLLIIVSYPMRKYIPFLWLYLHHFLTVLIVVAILIHIYIVYQ